MNALKKFLEDRKNSTFFYIYLLVVIMGFIGASLSFFIPIYLANLGFSGFQIGVLYAVTAITGLLFVFQIGLFTDRIPIKTIVALGISLITLYLFGFSVSKSFLVILILFFLCGLGYTIFVLATDSFVLKKIYKKIGKNFGLFSAVRSIPAAIGILAGGYLLFSLEFPTALRILGFLLLLSLFFVRYIPKTKKSIESVTTYFKDFLTPKVLIFSLLLFIFTLHWGVESVVYGLFLKENLQLDYIQMGWYMGIPILFLGFSSIYLGRLYDKGLSARKLLLTSFLLSGLGFALMAVTTNTFVSFIFRVIHEIGDGAFTLVMFLGTASFFVKKRIGGNYGLITLITVIGRVTGSLIFSPIGAAYGYEWPHIICGALVFVCGLFFFFFRNHK